MPPCGAPSSGADHHRNLAQILMNSCAYFLPVCIQFLDLAGQRWRPAGSLTGRCPCIRLTAGTRNSLLGGKLNFRRVFSVVAACALLSAPLAPASAAPADVAYSHTLEQANQQQISDVFTGINNYRASLGVPPVKFNVTVSEMAEDWSDHMAAVSIFQHNPGYYQDPRVVGRWTSAGEIIAARGDTRAQGLVDQWINSPGHEAIMRNPKFNTIGVGVSISPDSQYRMYGTVNFFAFTDANAPSGTYTSAQDFFGSQSGAPFTDFYQSRFQDAIAWMKDKKISEGYPDGTYRPFESVSREAMAAFIYRLAGSDYVPPTESPFTDVPTTHLFYKEIAFMNFRGISTGWPDRTYRPLEPVSREAMAAFMNRFAGAYCGIPAATGYAAPSAATFPDSRSSGFYREIEWMRSAGVTTGWEDGTYRPFDHVSREAMAAFMQRLSGYIAAHPGNRCL